MEYKKDTHQIISLHQQVYQSLQHTSKHRMESHKELVIMNFDNAYKEQDFYQDIHYHWIDCTKISGTNCYCDDDAKIKIRDAISPYALQGIHYIDSGNFHYVSELWLEKAIEPFLLVVFDHHTDMQPSLFESLLSCGCWVGKVIETNPYVQKVCLIGTKEELITQIPSKYKDKVLCYAEHDVDHDQSLQRYLEHYQELPVYISIDKDVLSKEDAFTNWDQGSMTLNELKICLHHILKNHDILGVDICGEYSKQGNLSGDVDANHRNNIANEELLNVILEEER